MNIYDVITDDPIKVEQFDAACVSLSKSRYILAESKIKAVLKIVATSSLLQNAGSAVYERNGRIAQR